MSTPVPRALHAGPFFYYPLGTMSGKHIPVLADEVQRLASPCRRVVDCTLGDGGHSALLVEGGRDLLAIDRDPDALRIAQERIGSENGVWLNCAFADPQAVEAIKRFRPDFVLFDLGVSSRQLDTDSRGFSFRRDVPLDMRMTQGVGPTAAELLNGLETAELARVFREFADEPKARQLANTIVRRRSQKQFATSDDLVNAIRAVLGSRAGPSEFARLFQAVRIEVNDEIDVLDAALSFVLDVLQPGGLVVVISYHSAEDRLVKNTFREWARSCVCPPKVPQCSCRGRALGENMYKKPVYPTPDEVAANPRARSAKMRAFRKSDAS